MGGAAAPAGVDRDVLHAADAVGHGAGDGHVLDRIVPELSAGVGGIGGQGLVDGPLEHQVTGGGQHAARAVARIVDPPGFPLPHRIPGGEPGVQVGLAIFRDLLALLGVAGEGEAVAAAGGVGRGGRIAHVGLGHREIGQAGQRAEGHRVEVVRARGARRDHHRGLAIAGGGVLDGPAGAGVYAGRPAYRDIGPGRDQLSRLAVQHIEEAVLGGLHQHVAQPAADLQVGQDHRLGGRVVPLLAGGLLVVPGVFAVPDVDRQDR